MRKPSELQKKTVAILKDNPKKKLGPAMREAGYKLSTSRSPKDNFWDLKGTAIAIEHWREALRGSGIHEGWLIKKYHEWGEATKIKSSLTEPDKVVPDYETQLKVKDDIRRDLGLPVEKINTAVQVNVGNEMKLEFIGDNKDASQTQPVADSGGERSSSV